MKPVFFSVIIPIYQAKKHLKKCLKSLKNQSFKNFEIVAIDDNSMDNCVELIKKFNIENPNIQIQLYVNEQNLGLGATRNRGINQALGKYVCFLDADDFWEPKKLEILYKKIKGNPNFVFFYHPIKELPKLRKRSCYPVKNVYQLVFKYNPIVPSAVALRSDLAKKYPHLQDKTLQGVEDFDLWIRLLNDGIKPYFFKDVLTVYRPNSGMSTKLDDHLQKVQKILELHLGPTESKKALLQKYYEAGRSCMKMGKFKNALYYFVKSEQINFKALYFRSLCLLKT